MQYVRSTNKSNHVWQQQIDLILLYVTLELNAKKKNKKKSYLHYMNKKCAHIKWIQSNVNKKKIRFHCVLICFIMHLTKYV